VIGAQNSHERAAGVTQRPADSLTLVATDWFRVHPKNARAAAKPIVRAVKVRMEWCDAGLGYPILFAAVGYVRSPNSGMTHTRIVVGSLQPHIARVQSAGFRTRSCSANRLTRLTEARGSGGLAFESLQVL
jgi:hypothetical protein